MHTAQDWETEWDRDRLGTMDFYVMLCPVHTTLRMGMGPEPIVSYCVSPVPCTRPGPSPMQCDSAIS